MADPTLELARLLRESADEIVTQWSRDLKAAGGTLAERPLDELESACRQGLDGVAGVLERGDHTRLRWFVHGEVRGRVALGFRASDIARVLTSVKPVVWALLGERLSDNAPALASSTARMDALIDTALAELLDEYERVAQSKLEEHLAEMEALNRRLEELSVRDPLTGLYNRRYFMDRLNHEFQRAARHSRPLAALMLDLDHFKLVNDTYGHQVGDEVLRNCALMLVNQTRSTDIAARYGGEEFIALLPETDPAGALRVAEKLREAIAVVPLVRPGAVEGASVTQPIFCTVSVGVAELDSDQMDESADLLGAVDAAMYAAKNSGRNRALAAWTLPHETLRANPGTSSDTLGTAATGNHAAS